MGVTRQLRTDEARGSAVCLRFTTATFSMDTFDDSWGARNGGAMAILDQSNVTISNALFQNNRATSRPTGEPGDGGALYIAGSEVIVEDSLFTSNEARRGSSGTPGPARGGAIAHGIQAEGSSGTVTIRRCEFRNNEAKDLGGAIFVRSSAENNTIVRTSLFEGNLATAPNGSNGGGIAAESSRVEVLRNEFFDCEAGGSGGAIHCYDVDAESRVSNNLVVRGRAGQGGGISFHSAPPTPPSNAVTLTSNTLTECYSTGSSMNAVALLVDDGRTYVTNTVSWGHNQGGAIGGGLTFYTGFSCIQNHPNNNVHDPLDFTTNPPSRTNIYADPRFVAPSGGDYHLSEFSPCIDDGQNGVPELTDLDIDGEDRISTQVPGVPAVIDMGADEFHDYASQ